MRGGEAEEQPRYGLTRRELEEQRAEQRAWQHEEIVRRTQWVCDEAIEYADAQAERFMAMHMISK